MRNTTIGVLALLLASGCVNVEDDNDMADLTKDVAPGNLGGPSMLIPPAGAAGVGAFGRLVTVLKFPGRATPSDQPETLTASIFASPSTELAAQPPSAGPLVGVVLWGSGNGNQQQAEFDVSYPGGPTGLSAGIGPGVSVGSGTMLTVLGTSLEIAVRNDGNLMPRAGDARLGPAAFVPAGTFSAIATASLAVGNRATARLWRTIFGAFNPAGGLAAGDTTIVPVPPFAKSVRIARSNSAQAVEVRLIGITADFNGPFTIAAGADSPEFVVSSLVAQVSIKNTGAAAIPSVAAIFEIGL